MSVPTLPNPDIRWGATDSPQDNGMHIVRLFGMHTMLICSDERYPNLPGAGLA